MKRGNRDELGYRVEALMPMYGNLYVKQFVLFDYQHRDPLDQNAEIRKI